MLESSNKAFARGLSFRERGASVLQRGSIVLDGACARLEQVFDHDAAGIAAIGLIASLQLWLILSHVPWGDEVQAWLIVHESPTFSQLLANLKYEGHPALWYLLIWPFPTLHSVAYLQIAIALTTLALIWRAPFRLSFKVLLVGSYYVLFEYGVIARSYGLGAMLFFAFVTFRARWWAWVILALMANISAHFMVLSAVCAALIVRERGASRFAAVWLLGCVLAVLTVLPAPPDVHPAIPPPTFLGGLLESFANLSALVVPVVPGQYPITWGGGVAGAPVLLQPFLSLIPAAFVPWALYRRGASLALLTYSGLMFALLLLGGAVYPLYSRHVGLLFLLIIGLEWVRTENGSEPYRFTVLWTAFLFICGLWIAACSIFEPFAPGARLAQLTRGRPVAAFPAYRGVEISAYDGRPTWNLQAERCNTFVRWNYVNPKRLPLVELRRRIERSGASYLATDDPRVRRLGLERVGEVQSMMGKAWLYRLPETGVGPRCG